MYVDVLQTWVSDGQIHTINVRIDPTNVVPESNEANNDSGKEIGRLPAPDHFPYCSKKWAIVMMPL